MILIGMFDSPFVRRVAVSCKLLELPFEHRNWSVGKDFELIRQFNPVGTSARAGPVGRRGADRFDRHIGFSGPDRRTGARAAARIRGSRAAMRCEPSRSRWAPPKRACSSCTKPRSGPTEKRYEPWVERCRNQMHGALAELDRIVQRHARRLDDRRAPDAGGRHGRLRVHVPDAMRSMWAIPGWCIPDSRRSARAARRCRRFVT